jgi:ribonuclease BN (tRNA processing enzyme)
LEIFSPGSTAVERRFALEILEIEAEQPQAINRVTVTAFAMKHPCGAPPYALRLEQDGKSLCYTGDTEWVEALVPAARGVDLFIAEAYFAERKVRFHLDWATLADRLDEIAPKRLLLTHMSPEMLDRPPPVGATAAEDGMIIEI